MEQLVDMSFKHLDILEWNSRDAGWGRGVMVNVATNSLKEEQKPWFLVLAYFLGVMSSCYGQFQATNVMSLSIVLGRECTVGSHVHYWLQVKFSDSLAWEQIENVGVDQITCTPSFAS